MLANVVVGGPPSRGLPSSAGPRGATPRRLGGGAEALRALSRESNPNGSRAPSPWLETDGGIDRFSPSPPPFAGFGRRSGGGPVNTGAAGGVGADSAGDGGGVGARRALRLASATDAATDAATANTVGALANGADGGGGGREAEPSSSDARSGAEPAGEALGQLLLQQQQQQQSLPSPRQPSPPQRPPPQRQPQQQQQQRQQQQQQQQHAGSSASQFPFFPSHSGSSIVSHRSLHNAMFRPNNAEPPALARRKWRTPGQLLPSQRKGDGGGGGGGGGGRGGSHRSEPGSDFAGVVPGEPVMRTLPTPAEQRERLLAVLYDRLQPHKAKRRAALLAE